MKLQMVILGALVLGSALIVVYAKFHSRYLFTEIRRVEQSIALAQVEWDKLQLERSTLASPGRIERLARGKLGLVFPEREQIVYLKIEPSRGKRQ